MTLKEVNEKFLKGNALTDGELFGLLIYYKNLQKELESLGAEFDLFKSEIQYRTSMLQSFEEARKKD